MSSRPPNETREDREQLIKRAVADALRTQIAKSRLRQTHVARRSGISRSHLQVLLRANTTVSLAVCLELGVSLDFDDEIDFLREVLRRRAALREAWAKKQARE